MKLQNFFGNIDSDFRLKELINIETATVGISGAPFIPKCDDCSEIEDVFFDCRNCGKTKENFAQIRSGAGDGVYPVFQNMSVTAVAVLFDLNTAFAFQHRDWALGAPTPDLNLKSYCGDLFENEIWYLGKMDVSRTTGQDSFNLVAFSDCEADAKDVIAVSDVASGDLAIFVVLGPRSAANGDELVPRLLIAVGMDTLPESFFSLDGGVKTLPDSAGTDWFKFPVVATVAAGNSEFALFQTAKHCAAIAELVQAAGAAQHMTMWVSRGLVCVEKLREIDSELAHQLIGKLDEDFSDSKYEDYWIRETAALLEKQGIELSLFEGYISQESWYKSLGARA